MRTRPFRTNLFCLAWILLGQVLLSLVIVIIGPMQGVDGFVTVPAEVAFGVITAAVKLKLILVKVLFALRTIGLLRTRHSQRHKRSISATDLQSESNDLRMNEIIGDNQADILAAWDQLEAAANQRLDFDLSYCRLGVLAPNSVGHAPLKQLREFLEIEAESDRGRRRLKRRRRKRSVRKDAGEDSWEEKKDSTENLMLFFDSKEDTDTNYDESQERQYELVYDDGDGDLDDDYDLDFDNKPTGPGTAEVEDSRTIEVSYSEFVSATIGAMMGDMHGCKVLERGLN